VPGRRAVFAARFHNEKRESVHINFDGLRLVPSNVQTCAFRHSTSYAFVEETSPGQMVQTSSAGKNASAQAGNAREER